MKTQQLKNDSGEGLSRSPNDSRETGWPNCAGKPNQITDKPCAICGNMTHDKSIHPRVGDHVSFDHYGQKKTGIIAKVGKSVVFLTDGRWLHKSSVAISHLSNSESNTAQQ